MSKIRKEGMRVSYIWIAIMVFWICIATIERDHFYWRF